MAEQNYALRIAQALNLTEEQVQNTLNLLETGATIPFISRYRKEATGSLDEVQIGNIKDLYAKWLELDKRRAAILDSINEQGKLTPELREKIEQAETMTALEDLYLPYRPKRKTRATVAEEKGLRPLAKLLWQQRLIVTSEVKEVSAQETQVTFNFTFPDVGSSKMRLTYYVYGSGDIVVDYTFNPDGTKSYLPNVGTLFTVPGGYETVRFGLAR